MNQQKINDTNIGSEKKKASNTQTLSISFFFSDFLIPPDPPKGGLPNG